MASSRSPRLGWVRSHGRSTSFPTSPSSFDQRSLEQHFRPDATSPLDLSDSRSAASPSTDWRLSFPSFATPSLSSPASTYAVGETRNDQSEKPGHLLPKAREDFIPSPALSTPASASDYKSSPFQPYSGASFRTSPMTNYPRVSGEHARHTEKSPRSQERSFVTPRDISASSFSAERSSLDESNVPKASNTRKSRLNLLNPMSLLARRRASQAPKLEELKVAPSRVPAIPDFDPSIRGNIVHDFSSPRVRTPRRDLANETFQSRIGEVGNNSLPPSSPPTMYSPVFREHFHDDDHSLQPGQTAYLHKQPLDPPKPHSLPAFAQRLPVRLPSDDSHAVDETKKHKISLPDVPPPSPPVHDDRTAKETSSSVTPPRHKPSTSSRFSFQIAGHGSSNQEKILEDKHREHFARDPHVAKNEMQDLIEDDFDDFDMDAQDMFEEEIPVSGMDDDWVSQEATPMRNIEVATSEAPTVGHTNENMDLRLKRNASPIIGHHTEAVNDSSRCHHHHPPRRVNDKPGYLPDRDYSNHILPMDSTNGSAQTKAGFTQRSATQSAIDELHTKDLSAFAQHRAWSNVNGEDVRPNFFLDGLKISTTHESDDQRSKQFLDISIDDGELYFDDGEFEMSSGDPQNGFDESLFDEGSSQIRDVPAENAKRYQEALQRSGEGGKVVVSGSTNDEDVLGITRWTNATSASSGLGVKPCNTLVKKASSFDGCRAPSLTEDNLVAYHDALAMAAADAAANGRFDRKVSFDGEFDGQESFTDLVKLEDRDELSGDVYSQGSYVADDNRCIYDDDDELDEDLLIAEANAEALENDDEGFYGQEFGFYARARGKEPSDLVNGGFFSTRGANGVKRSHSGRGDFQEPSLTPITERSEWSARNSIASVHMLGLPGTAATIAGPGLNQLLDSPLLEDEMSLSALRKLRRGAFGGSSSSISSLVERGPSNNSPLANVSVYGFPDPDLERGPRVLPSQNLAASISILESEEENEEFRDYTTAVKHHVLHVKKPEMPRRTSGEQAGTPHFMLDPPSGNRGHHRRSSSGAESVSYAQDSTGRWVLERLRTGDSGEIEVIAREYLAGAHI